MPLKLPSGRVASEPSSAASSPPTLVPVGLGLVVLGVGRSLEKVWAFGFQGLGLYRGPAALFPQCWHVSAGASRGIDSFLLAVRWRTRRWWCSGGGGDAGGGGRGAAAAAGPVAFPAAAAAAAVALALDRSLALALAVACAVAVVVDCLLLVCLLFAVRVYCWCCCCCCWCWC